MILTNETKDFLKTWKQQHSEINADFNETNQGLLLYAKQECPIMGETTLNWQLSAYQIFQFPTSIDEAKKVANDFVCAFMQGVQEKDNLASKLIEQISRNHEN